MKSCINTPLSQATGMTRQKAFYKNLCGSDIIKWGIFHTANEAIGLEWNEYYEGHADAHMELVLHYIPADGCS